jgi:spore coat protein U-like protein
MKTLQKIGVLIGATLLCASSLTQAATSTGNLSVSAIVTATCSVNSAALPFGTGKASVIKQSSPAGVNCSNGTSYTINLVAGNGTQQNLPVYGYIPSGQNVQTGSYTDVVGITLSY